MDVSQPPQPKPPSKGLFALDKFTDPTNDNVKNINTQETDTTTTLNSSSQPTTNATNTSNTTNSTTDTTDDKTQKSRKSVTFNQSQFSNQNENELNALNQFYDKLVSLSNNSNNTNNSNDKSDISLTNLKTSLSNSIEIPNISINDLKSLFYDSNDNSSDELLINRETFSDKILKNADQSVVAIKDAILNAAVKLSESVALNENKDAFNAIKKQTHRKRQSLINDSSLKDALNKKRERSFSQNNNHSNNNNNNNLKKNNKKVHGHSSSNNFFDKNSKYYKNHTKNKDDSTNNNSNDKNSNNNKKRKSRKPRTKQEMTDALTTLITKFDQETREQEDLLTLLEKSASSDPDFAKIERCKKWSVQEVCYWLITIGMEDYIYRFYEARIDGIILFSDITQVKLENDLKVKKIHSSKLIRAIYHLQQTILLGNNSEDEEEDGGMMSDANNGGKHQMRLEDEISNLKTENENLQIKWREQKDINKQMRDANIAEINKLTQIITEFDEDKNKMIQALYGSVNDSKNPQLKSNMTEEEMNNIFKISERQNDPLRVALQAQLHAMETELSEKLDTISILKETISQIKKDYNKKIKKQKERILELQDGYIKLEKHYELQLKSQINKNKTLQLEMRRKSIEHNNMEVGMLWNENEQFQKQLESEKEHRQMLESKVKTLQFDLTREIQKRKLLEDQAARLTMELTQYLVPADVNNTANVNNNNMSNNSRTSISNHSSMNNLSIAGDTGSSAAGVAGATGMEDDSKDGMMLTPTGDVTVQTPSVGGTGTDSETGGGGSSDRISSWHGFLTATKARVANTKTRIRTTLAQRRVSLSNKRRSSHNIMSSLNSTNDVNAGNAGNDENSENIDGSNDENKDGREITPQTTPTPTHGGGGGGGGEHGQQGRIKGRLVGGLRRISNVVKDLSHTIPTTDASMNIVNNNNNNNDKSGVGNEYGNDSIDETNDENTETKEIAETTESIQTQTQTETEATQGLQQAGAIEPTIAEEP